MFIFSNFYHCFLFLMVQNTPTFAKQPDSNVMFVRACVCVFTSVCKTLQSTYLSKYRDCSPCVICGRQSCPGTGIYPSPSGSNVYIIPPLIHILSYNLGYGQGAR
jgi:hypothetical protein